VEYAISDPNVPSSNLARGSPQAVAPRVSCQPNATDLSITGPGTIDGWGATIGVTVGPKQAAAATISWPTKSDLVSLNQTTGPNVAVTARNTTSRPQWIPITAASPRGFCVNAHICAEPRHLDPPAIASAPKISPPPHGDVSLTFALDLCMRQGQSLISLSICDDSAYLKAREVEVSRGNRPLKMLALIPMMRQTLWITKHCTWKEGLRRTFSAAPASFGLAEVPTFTAGWMFHTPVRILQPATYPGIEFVPRVENFMEFLPRELQSGGIKGYCEEGT